MPPLFRRKNADSVTDPAEGAGAQDRAGSGTATKVRGEVPSVAGAATRSYTPGKGKATPKRREAQGKRVEAPPTNRREALKRMREKRREERVEQRAGMMAGKEEYLLPRDKGPERALIRDLVDARRNVATWFFGGALVVIVGSAGAMPAGVQLAANLFWVLLAIAVVGDSFLLSRKVRKRLRESFPKSTASAMGNYFYAIMRSLSFRRMRMPAPRVRLGDKV